MGISDEVYNLAEDLIRDKKFFNLHPELGFEEYITSNYISKRLKNLGYEVIQNVAKTGIVGIIKGSSEGQCIAFRADMDAVMTVPNDISNVKHVCGHDAHMAILLALAKLMADNVAEIKGTLKLIFQPAEEGSGGAEVMISEGVLENPNVEKIFSLHVWSELDESKIGLQDGPIMASGDEFEIKVFGKGGHAALPEKSVDAIFIASQIVLAMQSIVSKNVNPMETAVITVTAFNGGCNYNTICDEVTLKGTCRTYSNAIRVKICNLMLDLCKSIANAFGGKAEVDYRFKHPPVINWKEDTERIARVCKDYFGEENIITGFRTMCTEDFSHFLQKTEGVFLFVGCSNGGYYPQHSSDFFVPDKTLLIGTELLYRIAREYTF